MNLYKSMTVLSIALLATLTSGCKPNTPPTKETNPAQETKPEAKKGGIAPNAQFSKLWGKEGEKWNPQGRLPDFSYAGYHSGEKPIPSPSQSASVLTFGARPNDEIDDSAAFQKAIDSTQTGVILIPKGRYILSNFLEIKKSGIVLRGEGQGQDGTILYMPKPATEISGKKDYGFATGGSGQIISFSGANTSPYLTNVKPGAQRGTHTVTVDNPSKIKAGDKVMLQVNDDKLGGAFWRHLHNDRLNSWQELVDWAAASGKWLFTVTKVKGNQVTFKEPLRFDIRAPWSAQLLGQNQIEECGIENIRLEFPSDVQATPHLQEPGYNGILFIRANNCWVQGVTIANADNAITAKYECGHITLKNITLEGRRGHHGLSLSGASNCLIEGLTDNCREPWIHTVTMDHLACGNVHKGTKGTNTVSLDFHRHIPFENLHTDIHAKWNYESSGDPKAGPHAGARNVYWGLSGQAAEAGNADHKGRDFLYRHWGKIQTTVVGDLSIPEQLTDDEEWYENVPNLYPRDLHKAQLNVRLNK